MRIEDKNWLYPPSPNVIENIVKHVGEVCQYPDTLSNELKVSIANYNKVSLSQIIVGNGSDELISLTSKAYLDYKSKIMIFTPTFSQYERTAKWIGAKVTRIPSLKDFRYNIDTEEAISEINEETKIIWLCNPNNPTANIIPSSKVEEILNSISSSILLALDECYYEFSKETAIDLVRRYENLIIFRSFSKTFNLSGLRLGYAIASERIIKKISKIKLPYNVNILAQIAGVSALDDLSYYNEQWAKMDKEKNWLMEKLRDISNITVLPSSTNFILIKILGNLVPNLIQKELIKKKVPISPSWSYDFSGLPKSYFRAPISKRENNAYFISTLQEIMSHQH